MHPKETLPDAFKEIGIEVRLLKALGRMGFNEPSDIQKRLIPIALEGKDVLGQARTGTGKTAAFALPILQQIDPGKRLQALCLAPTRELAVQVTGEVKRLAQFCNIHTVAVFGGEKIAKQLHALGKKPHFVVGTPGRVMDMMRRGALDIRELSFVVLDEVDRMLDIGFRDDIKAILSKIKTPHQTIFVSATIDDEIKRLAKQYMNDPVEANVSQDRITVDDVDQSYITVEAFDKFRLLKLILEKEDPPITIVFCNTKAAARKLAARLHNAGIQAEEIHGDLMQRKRDRVMQRFRKHNLRVLVATDLAARGIDVSDITHIINYDIPPDPEVYVHRIGRTGRMGAEGVAITFVTREQGKELTNVELLINREVPERKVEGFKPRQPREEQKQQEPTPPSRLETPVHADAFGSSQPPPRKTLGGRFKPRRRRRL